MLLFLSPRRTAISALIEYFFSTRLSPVIRTWLSCFNLAFLGVATSLVIILATYLCKIRVLQNHGSQQHVHRAKEFSINVVEVC